MGPVAGATGGRMGPQHDPVCDRGMGLPLGLAGADGADGLDGIQDARGSGVRGPSPGVFMVSSENFVLGLARYIILF